MSEYPASGGWPSNSSNGAPAPQQNPSTSSQLRPFTVPNSNTHHTPFQCGICYVFLTANVDELHNHIDNHKRDLSDRIQAQQNQAQTQQPQTVDGAYQTAGPSQLYYPATAVNQQPTYDYQQFVPVSTHSMGHYRDPRSPIPHTEYRTTSEEFYYNQQPSTCQEGSSGLPSLSSENWARNPGCSVATVHQEDCAPSAKRTRYEGTVRNDVFRDSVAVGSGSDSRCQPQQHQQQQQHQQPQQQQQQPPELVHGQERTHGGHSSDSVLYHDLQPAKSLAESLAAAQETTEPNGFQAEQELDDQQLPIQETPQSVVKNEEGGGLMRKISSDGLSTPEVSTPERCKDFSPENSKDSLKDNLRFTDDPEKITVSKTEVEDDGTVTLREQIDPQKVAAAQGDERRRTSTRRSARAKKGEKHSFSGQVSN